MLRISVFKLLFSIEVFLLLSCNNSSPIDPTTVHNTVLQKDSVIFANLYSEIIDMENITDDRISNENFFSGKKSNVFSENVEYGISFIKLFKDLPSYTAIQKITVDIKSYSTKKINDAILVLSIDNTKDSKNILWIGQPLLFDPLKQWNNNSFSYDIKPEYLNPDFKISIYAWNKTKEEFFVDDLIINVFGTTTIKKNAAVSNSNFFYDFETTEEINGSDNIKPTTAHSGKYAVDLTGGKEYGPGIGKTIGEISTEPFKKVAASIWVYPTSENPDLLLTASSIDDKNNQTIFWEGKSTKNSPFPLNTWTKLNASFNVPSEKLSTQNMILVNVWNKGKTNVIVDDLEIVYGSPNERKGIASAVDPNTIYENRYTPAKNKPPFETVYLNKQSVNIAILNEYSSADEFVSGNFIKNSAALDQLLCIKKNKAKLFSYNATKKSVDVVWESDNANELILKSDCLKFSGDFNSDGKCDVLLINSISGEWNLLNFIDNKWNVIISGKNTIPKKWLDPAFIVNSIGAFTNKKNALVASTTKGFSALELINDQFIEKEFSVNYQSVFSPNDFIYEGNYTGSTTNEFIKLNTDARFDLKLITSAAAEYIINATLDFKGYEKDYNPKYYEFTKLVSGNFINEKQSSFITFSCNCLDADFNGKKCNIIENLSFLPNTVSLYSIEKK